jgi:DNA-binding transcriptional ArsR family regulator
MARSLADVVGLFRLAGDPTRALILLELGAGPRDTTALAAAAGRPRSQVSHNLTRLRLAGLAVTTPAGKHRLHALTPAGRTLAEAIGKLSEH